MEKTTTAPTKLNKVEESKPPVTQENTNEAIKTPPVLEGQPAQQKQPTHFEIEFAKFQEFLNCIDGTVSNRFAKQTIYNAVNELFVAKFPE